MSRKTIQISIPAAPATTPPPGKTAGVDSWVTQAPPAAKPLEGEILSPKPSRDEGITFTIRLSAQPDLFEAAKIFFFLPQAALWCWSFGLAQRTLLGPYGPR
jgi:hypothetical protein